MISRAIFAPVVEDIAWFRVQAFSIARAYAMVQPLKWSLP